VGLDDLPRDVEPEAEPMAPLAARSLLEIDALRGLAVPTAAGARSAGEDHFEERGATASDPHRPASSCF
jgi:hypothetical protein